MKRNQTTQPAKFALNIILTLALGVVVAIVATYVVTLVAMASGPLDQDWESFASLITGTVFGLVVGYRFCTLSHNGK